VAFLQAPQKFFQRELAQTSGQLGLPWSKMAKEGRALSGGESASDEGKLEKLLASSGRGVKKRREYLGGGLVTS